MNNLKLFSVNEIRPFLINPNLSESKIVTILKEISKGFTEDRKKGFSYQNSADYVCAYTLFYLITNFPKLKFILDLLPDDLVKEIGESSFYDIGSGPGTYTVGFLEYFKNINVECFAIDQSEIMLKQAESLCRGLYPGRKVSFDQSIRNSNKKKCFFFGHSINEMGIEVALNLIEKHQPQLIIFIEPGTSYFFKTSLELRNSLRKLNYNLNFPCPSGVSECPLANSDDWCHQILRTVHHPSVESLSQKVGLDRKTMPMIANVFSKEKFKNKKNRIIRFLGEDKHSYRYQLCHKENLLNNVEVAKKYHSKGEQKKISAINVGESLHFKTIKVLGNESLRVSISSFKDR